MTTHAALLECLTDLRAAVGGSEFRSRGLSLLAGQIITEAIEALAASASPPPADLPAPSPDPVLATALDRCVVLERMNAGLARRLYDAHQALALTVRCIRAHQEWCGYKKDSPGSSIINEALGAAGRVLAPPSAAASSETPAQAPDCAGCGGVYRFDTTIPSPLWNSVIRSAGLPEYLCAACIIRAFAKAGEGFTATLWGDEFDGTAISVMVAGRAGGKGIRHVEKP